jgi:hypothetical protein
MAHDIFRDISESERAAGLTAYAQFLAERDGEPDFQRGTLSHREAAMQRFESSAALADGPFDHALFSEQLRRFDRRRTTTQEMLLLLTFVQINANEAYAVDQVLPRKLARGSQLERLVLLEELYHTRLLRSAARLFGAKAPGKPAPVAITRAIVSGIARLPELAARPITLAGEITGIVTFLRLIAATRRVFADRPALRDAFEERALEVLIDEIGHLSLNRLLAKKGALRAARTLLPAFALGTRGALPEAEALDVLPLPIADVMSFELRQLPEEVRRRAFVA